jgi:RNAse (barnase) inhibitor barstar
MNFDDNLLYSTAFYSIFTQQLKLMIMEIVNIEAGAFMEMNNILFKIEKQLKGLNFSKSELNEWLDNQDVCILMNISDRKLLSLRQKGLIPFSRIDRKVYYNKEDILNYMKKNLKTHTNNGNGTDGIE